jgi:flagellar biosynthesis/type III secretory pathway chaperone
LEDLTKNLVDTLSRMTTVYKDILQAAQDKRKHIISGDVDKLESVIYRERNLAENILLLERKRRYIMQSISKAIGKGVTISNLRELIEYIQDPYKSELEKQYDAISEVIKKVKDINKINTLLTKYSLEYVNKFIKAICSESLNDSVYQQSGNLKTPELKRLLFEVSA